MDGAEARSIAAKAANHLSQKFHLISPLEQGRERGLSECCTAVWGAREQERASKQSVKT